MFVSGGELSHYYHVTKDEAVFTGIHSVSPSDDESLLWTVGEGGIDLLFSRFVDFGVIHPKVESFQNTSLHLSMTLSVLYALLMIQTTLIWLQF